MTPNELLAALNPTQRAAAEHIDGPLLILAGPGSGKTRVVTHRVANMLAHGIPDWQILALTFTNKAADEMQRRLERLAPGANVWMGTFHRFCARQLRKYAGYVGLSENYSIYDTDDSLRLLKRTLDELEVDLTHFTPERLAQAISTAKNGLLTAENYQASPGNPLGAIMEKVYPAYQRALLDTNAVDFDDLLVHFATLLRENAELRAQLDERFRYIMVDEYQDTNLAQYAIVRAMSIDHPNLAVTGDPDQSIYGWRGANLNNILEFERDYPNVKVVRLEQNYRSTPNILRVADALIAHNVRRKKKTLFTDNTDGQPVRLVHYPSHRDEADTIATRIATDLHSGRRRARDFAIFYRVNALSRTLEFSLREHGIPYQIVSGVEFFQRKEIKDILAYLDLINNPRDDVALLRIFNTPPRGIGKTTIDRLQDHRARNRISLLDAARECGLVESINKRAAVAVAKFVSMFDKLCIAATEPVEAILGHVLVESGYRQWLLESESEEDQQRLANIEELLTAAREFDEQHPEGNWLEGFLEQISLVNETDEWEEETDKVTLMTLHAAKGLEFPAVFIVAVEEGLLPHERSRSDAQQLEEERRLLFVGITRAEEELEISLSQHRDFRGSSRFSVPSQFLMELPRDEMDVVEPKYVSRASFDAVDEFFDEEVAHTIERPREPAAPPIAGLEGIAGKLTTAAALLGEAGEMKSSIDPDVFELAMTVTHPQYGPGKIVALSGSREKRIATVRFAGGAGERKFRLSQSPLRPVQ